MEEIIGYLKSVKFTNPSNSYNVITVKLDQKKNESITIVGYFALPNKDQLVKYIGNYVENKKYGKQFEVESFEIVLPSSRVAIIRFLSSSLFYGVGVKASEKIVDALGLNCLEMIANDRHVLDDIDIKEEIKDAIFKEISKFDNLNEAIKIFVGHGISMKYLLKMDAIYHEKLVSTVLNDPYILIRDIDGLGFKTVDKLALSLGIKENDFRRLKSLIIYCLKNICYKTLDTYTSVDILYKECLSFVNDLTIEQFDEAYQALKFSYDIIDDNSRIFYKDFYYAEKGIATLLKPYINLEPNCIDKDIINKQIKIIEDEEGIIYSNEQVETIHNVLNSNISIITGGPGSGKTTVVNAIIKIYMRLYNNKSVNLVAPTGRASKRMNEISGFPSCTIHRFLKWDMETSKFQINQHNPAYGSFLIVDEFSMVDCMLFYSLLLGTINFSKILLIGDHKQLEPICPGNVLKDLIDSKLILVNELFENHRQADNSGIIPLCMDANVGLLNEANLHKDDVMFLETNSFNIRDTILNNVKDLIDKGYSQKQIQILAPMYDGVSGINSLNELIREYFNPSSISKKEIMIGTVKYRVGDKILQLKNQVDDNVFNGDIGYLETINNEDGEISLIVNFDDNLVRYTPNEFSNITHAYAISVHKAQGSEFDVVLLITSKEHNMMLRRKLIYTALSRAKKKLIIIGNKNSLIKGIQRVDNRIKKTTLKERLLDEFDNSKLPS